MSILTLTTPAEEKTPRPVKRMEPSKFLKIRDEITNICKQFSATGSNGRVPMLCAAIAGHFHTIGVPESDYWNEVAIRSGGCYLDAILVDKLLNATKPKKKWYQIWKK